MTRKIGQRAAIAVASAALAAGSGAVLFGGTAFAHGENNNIGGQGGQGGKAQSACLIPIGLSAGIVGQGGDQSACNATGGGAGNGGTGANY